jgi:hypothetical protein
MMHAKIMPGRAGGGASRGFISLLMRDNDP